MAMSKSFYVLPSDDQQVPVKTAYSGKKNNNNASNGNIYVEMSFADQDSYKSRRSSPVSNTFSQSSRSQTPQPQSNKRRQNVSLAQQVERM